MERSIILVGLMGVGKSRLAPLLGRRLSLPSLDTDAIIEKKTGLDIAEIFSEKGEARFRLLESEVLRDCLNGSPAVIAAGGGALRNAEAWNEIRASGALSVYLYAPTRLLASRLENSNRPLLAGTKSMEERISRLEEILLEREPSYRQADVFADAEPKLDVVEENLVSAISEACSRRISLRLKEDSHSFWLERDFENLGQRLAKRISPSGAALRTSLISDEKVFALYGQKAMRSLKNAGFEVFPALFPPGEASKNLETAEKTIDLLLRAGHQRASPVLALGGGVTGDLGGFVAAIIHRGSYLVQLPTTLISMVDSAIGGKTAVNHELGKNLIGAFHQPVLAYASLESLETLKQRDYLSGFGEIIKMALLEPGFELLDLLEKKSEALIHKDPDLLRPVIFRCASMKAGIVEEDPKDSLGRRRILNLGHTFAHAMEVTQAYKGILHGEAVGLGLLFSCRVGSSLGLLSSDMEARIANLLRLFNLPWQREALDLNSILEAVVRDKKMEKDKVFFVVPVSGGGADFVSLSTYELKSILIG